FFLDPNLDPRHLAAELPRGGEPVGRLTLLDGAVGIALEAVAATYSQVATDGQEPPGDPVGIRHGVPEVVYVGRIDPAGGEHAGLPGLQRPGSDRPADFGYVVGDVERHVCFLSRLPLATSVARASNGPAQRRRNLSSHSSTSSNPSGRSR